MAESSHTPTTLPFSTLSDNEVRALLKEHHIGLTVEEARTTGKMLQRDPTLVEAVIWGIQGSEHCSYKSSGRFLKGLPTQGKHVILGPGEDSGIVAITDGPTGKRWGLVISHESHNHPSQIVPYEGAATGVGGVVRDVVCMGARVVGCMDMLRLGDQKTEESCTIATEVARGIAGYGNPLGIPNLGGDTVYDSTYNSNCLVNAVALGIVREDEIIHSSVPEEAGNVGYDIIIVGKPTDRSGFGGASFASASMEEEKKEQNTGAVQEPNPFLERHLLASTYALFDWLAAQGHLRQVSFKDLGAGGVVCSSVEQVAERGFGAELDLSRVHVSIADLPPEVIACAETQERFCWICHPDLTDHILTHYNEDWNLPSVAKNARASHVGKVTADGLFRLRYHGTVVCEAKARDITCGLSYTRPTAPLKQQNLPEPTFSFEGATLRVDTENGPYETTLREVLYTILADPNHCTHDGIIRHYDKNVIGNTIIEPGEADAAVFAPLLDLASYVHVGTHPGWKISEEERWTGVAVAGDGKGRYGRINPYLQGLNAAVESMRNVAAVGAIPRALTDCLNYGNPEIPEQLWQFSEGVRGIADAARGVHLLDEGVPVISGNVSFYNGKPDGSAIDPTAIVCCVGVLPDARKAITQQLKNIDSLLLLIGERRDECGGSAYYEILERMARLPQDSLLGFAAPSPDLAQASREIKLVTTLIERGFARACHDISDGGLLLTLLEMTLPQRKCGGTIGMTVDIGRLESSLRSDTILFSETGGFVLEVAPEDRETIESLSSEFGVTVHVIGQTQSDPTLVLCRDTEKLIQEKIFDIHRQIFA
ncbi:phosphoribosylformylglycinamidine synthase subunit PurL [Candidatus Peregrinibacteria bacterium CG10_big_fil_rev_8_21_14_0_10_55_24]|nr:MAG: phosphoribosylformylglycinamidine synthase subunit PurL [Candidatus Peregrinibacteria bacterium CG10_big_fil_rev_8_21_14_0_10_55_24]